VWSLDRMEPTLKYHPDVLDVLTWARDPGRGPCMVGSLTGAVSSQRVTEEHEGTLTVCNGISVLDCKIDGSSRYESRS
jgi:hypothetical protein